MSFSVPAGDLSYGQPHDEQKTPGRLARMKTTMHGHVSSRFDLVGRNTDVITEVRAGTATFLTMAYILLVNPQVLGVPHTGIPRQDVVIATALSSALASFIVGFFGNLPLGMAPGLGLSAYFSYGLVKGDGLSWQSALTSCMVAGLVMLFLAVTRLSNTIMLFIPRHIKLATVVGMGLLLTFIGMQSIRLVVAAPDSLVRMGDLMSADGMPVWLSLSGLMLLSTLTFHRIKGAVLIGILAVTLLVWQLNDTWPTQIAAMPSGLSVMGSVDFNTLGTESIPGILAFLFVGIFDVSGVLYGLAKLSGLVRGDGVIPGSTWAFIGAGVGTILAAYLGCSPIIIHVESAAGIKEGGRTGLAAVTTSFWFLLSIFFAPLFEMVPPEATAPVLIMIGAMMMGEATEIEWKEMDIAIPSFLTVAMMPFTFSIPNGIVFGMISSAILFITTGKFMRYCKRGAGTVKDDSEDAWLMPTEAEDGTGGLASYGTPGGRSGSAATRVREPSFIESITHQVPYERQPSLILRKEDYERPFSPH